MLKNYLSEKLGIPTDLLENYLNSIEKISVKKVNFFSEQEKLERIVFS